MPNNVRQYVGARYVPKFSDPVAWQSGTSYEALTIVTYNNSSYTSKIPVPATVGNPADNDEYWALTGNYNAQVEAYREEAVAVQENLNETNEQVSTIENTITQSNYWVTPEMFGAKGDGTTDDTEAIQNAFNSGKKVQFWGKTYLITNDLTVSNMCEIAGVGSNTKIVATSEKPCTIYINNSTETLYNTTINDTGTSIHDIFFHYVSLSFGTEKTGRFFSVHVYDCTWFLCNIWPIILNNHCAFMTFTNLHCENTNGLVYMNGVQDGESVISSGSTNSFIACLSANSYIASVYINGTGNDGFSPSFINCSLEHTPTSFYATGTIKGRLDVYAPVLHVEANTDSIIDTTTLSGNSIFIINDLWNSSPNADTLFKLSTGTRVYIGNGSFMYQSSSQKLADGEGSLHLGQTDISYWGNRNNGNYNIYSKLNTATTDTWTTANGIMTPVNFIGMHNLVTVELDNVTAYFALRQGSSNKISLNLSAFSGLLIAESYVLSKDAILLKMQAGSNVAEPVIVPTSDGSVYTISNTGSYPCTRYTL